MIASMFPASRSPGLRASHCAGSGVMNALSGEVVQVLSGVVDIHDVGGVRAKRLGHGPDPDRAVAERDDLTEVLAAAAQVLGLDPAGEGVLAVEGEGVAGRARVHHRPAPGVEPGHGEQPRELDLPAAGLLSDLAGISISAPAARPNGTSAPARAIISARPGDSEEPATPSCWSRGANPQPQSRQ
jgi:hypothetical protein